MRFLLKWLSVLVIWGAVAYMVVYVDPETVRDIGLEGMYLPFLAIVMIAVWYTVMTVVQSWMVASAVAVLMGLAIELSILRLLSWFTLLIILLLILFAWYLHKRRDSTNESERRVK